MAHDKVFGICENKCLVPVAPKTETDVVADKVDGFDSRIAVLETVVKNESVTADVYNIKVAESGLIHVGTETLSFTKSDSFTNNGGLSSKQYVIPSPTLTKPEQLNFVNLSYVKTINISVNGGKHFNANTVYIKIDGTEVFRQGETNSSNTYSYTGSHTLDLSKEHTISVYINSISSGAKCTINVSCTMNEVKYYLA